MARYTVTLDEFAESYLLASYTGDDPEGYAYSLSVDDKVTAIKNLFPDTYDFYSDESSVKAKFEREFAIHFMCDEIGCETVGRFKLFLAKFLNERMPYYRDLFNSRFTSIADALSNYDITTSEDYAKGMTRNRQGSETSAGVSSDSSDTTSKHFTFPVNSTSEETMRDTDNDTASSTTSESSLTSDNEIGSESRTLVQHKSGSMLVDKVKRTKDYRNLIFSINELIFSEMERKGLFMKIF